MIHPILQGGKRVPFHPMLLKKLPPMDPLPYGNRKFQSCAVVGNSGVLLGSDYGVQVIPCPHVIRCTLSGCRPGHVRSQPFATLSGQWIIDQDDTSAPRANADSLVALHVSSCLTHSGIRIRMRSLVRTSDADSVRVR